MIFLTMAFKASRHDTVAMPAEPEDAVLQRVFGKAFLLELRRGNLDQARLFARAFLAHSTLDRFIAVAPVA